MKKQGKLIKRFITKGTSQAGKDWQKLIFVIQTTDQYDNEIAFEVFGDEKVQAFTFQDGDMLDVEFNIKCKEYKGKYFTSLSAWKINSATVAQPQAAVPAGDDLPF